MYFIMPLPSPRKARNRSHRQQPHIYGCPGAATEGMLTAQHRIASIQFESAQDSIPLQ